MIKFYDYAVQNHSIIRTPKSVKKINDVALFTPTNVEGYVKRICNRGAMIATSRIDNRNCVPVLELLRPDFGLRVDEAPVEQNLLLQFIDKWQLMMLNVSRLNFTARIFHRMREPATSEQLCRESFQRAAKFMMACDYRYARRRSTLSAADPNCPRDERLFFAQYLHFLACPGYVNYYLELIRRFRIKRLDIALATSTSTADKSFFSYERQGVANLAATVDDTSDTDGSCDILDTNFVITVAQTPDKQWLGKISNQPLFENDATPR